MCKTAHLLMVVKVKLFWRLFVAAVVLGGLLLAIQEVEYGAPSLKHYLALILSPLGIFAALVYAPTLHYTFTKNDVCVSWYLGLPWYKIWEHELFCLSWHRVDAVFSFLPWWIPITIIMVVGKQDGRTRMFALGTYMTHKKEALLFLAEHVRSDALGDEVEAMIARYRERV